MKIILLININLENKSKRKMKAIIAVLFLSVGLLSLGGSYEL